MALIKVRPTRTVEAFISEEPIGGLAVVCASTGGRSVKEGTSTNQELVVGVAPAVVASGVRCPVITHGIVSGVICGAVVSAGDRVTCTNLTSGGGLASGAGKITPINTITPAGAVAAPKINLVSGAGLAGNIVAADGQALATISGGGLMSGITGVQAPAFTGTAFNTARVVGKALDNGGIGSGIRLLVDIGA